MNKLNGKIFYFILFTGVVLSIFILLFKFNKPQHSFIIDLFSHESNHFRYINIFATEVDDGRQFKWLEGPLAGIKFYAPRDLKLVLCITINNPFFEQKMDIIHNGMVLCKNISIEKNKWMLNFNKFNIPFVATKGLNEIVIKPFRWNGNPIMLFQDNRLLAFALTRFQIKFQCAY